MQEYIIFFSTGFQFKTPKSRWVLNFENTKINKPYYRHICSTNRFNEIPRRPVRGMAIIYAAARSRCHMKPDAFVSAGKCISLWLYTFYAIMRLWKAKENKRIKNQMSTEPARTHHSKCMLGGLIRQLSFAAGIQLQSPSKFPTPRAQLACHPSKPRRSWHPSNLCTQPQFLPHPNCMAPAKDHATRSS